MTSEIKTHTAYALRREGRTTSRWLEIGHAYLQADVSKPHQVVIDRLPVGGFGGNIYLAPVGELPPEPLPSRPGDD